MYDGGKIILLLLAFIALVAFPFYFNAGKVSAKADPKTDTPEITKMADKRCIEDTELMRYEHMQLLNSWRDAVVRDGKGTYINEKGESFEMSLQTTCMKCHSNKTKFCDECHNYAGVQVYCWDCHTYPKESE